MFSEIPFGQRVGSGPVNFYLDKPLNFYLDKSMPTKTQHNTMSALVNNQRRMARRSKLKPRGEEEMSSALDRLSITTKQSVDVHVC